MTAAEAEAAGVMPNGVPYVFTTTRVVVGKESSCQNKTRLKEGRERESGDLSTLEQQVVMLMLLLRIDFPFSLCFHQRWVILIYPSIRPLSFLGEINSLQLFFVYQVIINFNNF